MTFSREFVNRHANGTPPLCPAPGAHSKRLAFFDETWTKTNMAPLPGWSPLGQRLLAKVPYVHWNTMTFIAALRHDRIEAP